MQDLNNQSSSKLDAYAKKYQQLVDPNFSFFDQSNLRSTKINLQYLKSDSQYYLAYKNYVKQSSKEEWNSFYQLTFAFPHCQHGYFEAIIRKQEIQIQINSEIDTKYTDFQVYAKVRVKNFQKWQSTKVGIRKFWNKHLLNISTKIKENTNIKYLTSQSYQYERKYGIYENLLYKIGFDGTYNFEQKQAFGKFNVGVQPLKDTWFGLNLGRKASQQKLFFLELSSVYKFNNYILGGVKVGNSQNGSLQLTGALDIDHYFDFLKKVQLKCCKIDRDLKLNFSSEFSLSKDVSLKAGFSWANLPRTFTPENYILSLKINH